MTGPFRRKQTTLAVVDFTDLQGNVTFLGRFLAEELSVSLADTGQGFRVIDRIHLASILREHKLSQAPTGAMRKLNTVVLSPATDTIAGTVCCDQAYQSQPRPDGTASCRPR